MPEHSAITTKTLLRQALREKRRTLSPELRAAKSLAMTQRCLAQAWYQTAKSVVAYYPNQREISPLDLLMLAQKQGKSCYLPVLDTQLSNKNLSFLPYQPELGTQVLRKNGYGIWEPHVEGGEERQPLSLEALKPDLILLPLLGFDSSGNRLGLGSAYYDLTLARVSQPIHALKVGLAFDCQEVDALPVDPWDVSLDIVVTESRLFVF